MIVCALRRGEDFVEEAAAAAYLWKIVELYRTAVAAVVSLLLLHLTFCSAGCLSQSFWDALLSRSWLASFHHFLSLSADLFVGRWTLSLSLFLWGSVCLTPLTLWLLAMMVVVALVQNGVPHSRSIKCRARALWKFLMCLCHWCWIVGKPCQIVLQRWWWWCWNVCIKYLFKM